VTPEAETTKSRIVSRIHLIRAHDVSCAEVSQAKEVPGLVAGSLSKGPDQSPWPPPRPRRT
jgi:hypothetical protein